MLRKMSCVNKPFMLLAVNPTSIPLLWTTTAANKPSNLKDLIKLNICSVKPMFFGGKAVGLIKYL